MSIDEPQPGNQIRVHDKLRPHQPVVGRYIGRSPHRHWLVDVGGETHLVAAELEAGVEILDGE